MTVDAPTGSPPKSMFVALAVVGCLLVTAAPRTAAAWPHHSTSIGAARALPR